MSSNRKSRAKINILVSLGSQILLLLCGIVVPRVMIGAFGSEVYGATASIAQFLSYITLLEGGIGGVARAVLYKPISNMDYKTLSAIIAEIKRFFNILGWIFVAYVLVIACSFRSISHVDGLDWISTFWLVIVISISSFGEYFIGSAYAIFLQADQKSYITNGVGAIARVLNAVCIILLIHAGKSIIVVKLVSSCIFLIRPVTLWLYVRKRYAICTKQPQCKQVFLKQKWSGLGQHIAYFLHSNTDVVILTVFADLRVVAVYSVYHMIVSHIKSLAGAFTSGMEAVFGDMLARKEYDRLQKSFCTYETIISLVAVTLFATTAILIIPFVKIYTSNIKDANYIVPEFSILLILSALCYCLRMPHHSMVIAAGHFKQTSLAAYGEAVINIGISVFMVFKYGLIGVAVGTLVATTFRFIYYMLYLTKHIIGFNIRDLVKRFVVNVISFGGSYAAGSVILSYMQANDYLQWCLCGIVVFIIVTIVTLGVNIILMRNQWRLLFPKNNTSSGNI